MGGSDTVISKSGYSVAELNEQTIIDGTTLSGSVALDFATADPDHKVTMIVITGAVTAGVTFVQPLNVPPGEMCAILFTDPGTNTPTFTGFKTFRLPVWAAGKFAYYQFKRTEVDATPANDFYLLEGEIEGGTIQATSVPDLPAMGVEVPFRQHPTFGQTFLQSWNGTMSAEVTVLGPALSGVMNHVVDRGGDLLPSVASGNSNQRWALPYSVGGTSYVDIQMQDNQARIIADSASAAQVPAYNVWLEYAKV